MAHDVFISYSSKDKPTADAVCATLESRGIRCWIAPRDVLPGEEYAAALVAAIHSSRLLVLVFSSGANQSPQVLREVERAVSGGLPILPLRIEDVPPSAAMEFYISSRHWLDALTTPLERHLVQLADTITLLLSRMSDSAAPAGPVHAVKPVPPVVVIEPAAPPPSSQPEAPQPTPIAVRTPLPEPRISKAAAVAAPMPHAIASRSSIAVAAVIMQVVIGAVSARGVFLGPMMMSLHLASAQAGLLSGMASVIFAMGALVGGIWMRASSPRSVAIAAGVLVGVGVVVSGLAQSFGVLLLSYGLLAGLGLGFAYIVSLSILVKWFPDRRGRVVGIAMAGFGAGVMLASLPLMKDLIFTYGVQRTLNVLGVVCLVALTIPARSMRLPPVGYAPQGWSPSPAQVPLRAARDFSLGEALTTWRWYGVSVLMFVHALCGGAAIWLVGAVVRDAVGTQIVITGGLGVFVIAETFGRLIWPWVSDAMGSRKVLFTVCLAQALLSFVLAGWGFAGGELTVFTALACLFYVCYSGAVATFPVLIADVFGPENTGAIYGLLLTTWSVGAILSSEAIGLMGTQIVRPLTLLLAATAVIPLLMRPPRSARSG